VALGDFWLVGCLGLGCACACASPCVCNTINTRYRSDRSTDVIVTAASTRSDQTRLCVASHQPSNVQKHVHPNQISPSHQSTYLKTTPANTTHHDQTVGRSQCGSVSPACSCMQRYGPRSGAVFQPTQCQCSARAMLSFAARAGDTER